MSSKPAIEDSLCVRANRLNVFALLGILPFFGTLAAGIITYGSLAVMVPIGVVGFGLCAIVASRVYVFASPEVLEFCNGFRTIRLQRADVELLEVAGHIYVRYGVPAGTFGSSRALRVRHGRLDVCIVASSVVVPGPKSDQLWAVTQPSLGTRNVGLLRSVLATVIRRGT